MAFYRGGLFRNLSGLGLPVQPSRFGRVIMDWTIILASLLTIGLIAYLAIALLLPEKFS